MNKPFDIEKQFTVSTGKVYRTSDNIILFDPRPDLDTQTLEEMKEMDIVFRKLLNGQKMPYLVDISNAMRFSSEEKNFAREGLKIFSSVAFVTNKSISRVIIHVFLMFQRNNPPMKIFSTMEEAKKWSLEFTP